MGIFTMNILVSNTLKFRRNTTPKCVIKYCIVYDEYNCIAAILDTVHYGWQRYDFPSDNVHSIIIYMCTNFGAFITKRTIDQCTSRTVLSYHLIEKPNVTHSENIPQMNGYMCAVCLTGLVLPLHYSAMFLKLVVGLY